MARKKKRAVKIAPKKAKGKILASQAHLQAMQASEKRDLQERIKVAHFLHEEIQRMLEVEAFQLQTLLSIWSRHRAREPFLNSLHHRYKEIPASHLLLLSPECVHLTNRFFKHLEDLALYVRFTEDMVLTLEDNIRDYFKKMKIVAEDLLPKLSEEILEADSSVASQ